MAGVLRTLSVDEWLAVDEPIVDVRSPGEFVRGHIPGAYSLPLFSNEERAVVGIIYKQQGRDPALLEGLRLVGPKLAWLVEEAQRIAPEGRIRVHCWRGGERSASVAWLLGKAGFRDVAVLKAGYKSFRKTVLSTFEVPLDLRVLGGYTGTGKTETLEQLRSRGEQVIDLEDFASHKGSAFGALGGSPQPSTEQFENLLWYRIRQLVAGRRVWVEDESAMIGRVNIPAPFFDQMRRAIMYFVDLPIEARTERLVRDYGRFPAEQLASAMGRIAKRLGPQHHKAAIEALAQGDLHQVARTALHYYDKSYRYGLSRRDPSRVVELAVSNDDPVELAQRLIELQ